MLLPRSLVYQFQCISFSVSTLIFVFNGIPVLFCERRLPNGYSFPNNYPVYWNFYDIGIFTYTSLSTDFKLPLSISDSYTPLISSIPSSILFLRILHFLIHVFISFQRINLCIFSCIGQYSQGVYSLCPCGRGYWRTFQG